MKRKIALLLFNNTKLPFGIIMITLNIKKSNTFFKETIQNYLNIVNFGALECPNCHSHDICRWGFYHRNIIFFSDESKSNLESDIIKIQRVRCKSCGKTHALLPIGVIPYKQLTTEIVIEIILSISSTSIENTFSKFNFISESTIKKIWLDFKKKHYSLLSIITKTRNVLDSIYIIKDNIRTQISYIHHYNRTFMQIKLGYIGVMPLS